MNPLTFSAFHLVERRDLGIHRHTALLRTLRRFGLDLYLGRTAGANNPEPGYVVRLGAQLALQANLGFMIVALVLVLALPRAIPDH